MQKVETFVVDYNKPNEHILDYGEGGEYPADLYQYTGVAMGLDNFASVTDEQINFFYKHGYLMLEHAFSPAEVKAGLDGLFSLIAGENPKYRGIMYERKAKGVAVDQLPPDARQDYVRKFMWFVEYEDRLKALAYHPQMLELLHRLLGDEPSLFQDMALIKPPRIGREKPWHQDHAYFDLPLNTPVVGVWIALDEATTENGCMVIYPGSHRQGPVVHFNRRDWQICDTYDRLSGALAVPLKPGGALFFHSLLHHGTPANTSTQRRRAVQFHYAPASAHKMSKEERLAIFGEEGKDVTC
jgi:phytanoyl-CoA hydroxylase